MGTSEPTAVPPCAKAATLPVGYRFNAGSAQSVEKVAPYLMIAPTTKTNVVWRHGKGVRYVEAALLYEGVLYVIRSGGILIVFDPETGNVLRETRLKDDIGEYYAQPAAGDGRVYFVSEAGNQRDQDQRELGDAVLGRGDGLVFATPAMADSRIYGRTDESLCFFQAPVTAP